MIINYDCPDCGFEIDVNDTDKQVKCTNPNCNRWFIVDWDAELVDGRWRDLTTLIPYHPYSV